MGETDYRTDPTSFNMVLVVPNSNNVPSTQSIGNAGISLPLLIHFPQFYVLINFVRSSRSLKYQMTISIFFDFYLTFLLVTTSGNEYVVQGNLPAGTGIKIRFISVDNTAGILAESEAFTIL